MTRKTGILGNLFVSENSKDTLLELYTTPTETAAVVTLNASQREANTAKINVFMIDVSGSEAFGDADGDDNILKDHSLEAQTYLERKGIVMGSQTALVVQSNSVGSAFMAWGFQEND